MLCQNANPSPRPYAHRGPDYVLCGTAKNSLISLRARAGFRRRHSQTTSTRQPSAFSDAVCSLSLMRVRVSLGSQYSRFDFGKPAIGQSVSGCQCQKQPLTKTIALWRGSTRSGAPGKSRRCRRNRWPRRCTIERTTSSGFMPRERIRDMHHERSSGLRLSAIPASHLLGVLQQRAFCFLAEHLPK